MIKHDDHIQIIAQVIAAFTEVAIVSGAFCMRLDDLVVFGLSDRFQTGQHGFEAVFLVDIHEVLKDKLQCTR